MSQEWVERQKSTRALVSAAADYVLAQRIVSADALYGLCQLTWITKDYVGEDAGYVRAVKLPGLRRIYGAIVPLNDRGAAADAVAEVTGDRTLARLVNRPTGITNLRNAYRNTSAVWIHQNRAAVQRIITMARALKSDADGIRLAREIDKLPRIPLRIEDGKMPTEATNLLSPVVFCLDPRFRFPVINGNPGLKGLIRSIGAGDALLEEKHSALVALIGKQGVRNAGDVDLLRQTLTQFKSGLSKRLRKKPESGTCLKVKDEADVEVVGAGTSKVRAALHNSMTNVFKERFEDRWELIEGDSIAKYDIQVVGFDDSKNLLIEAKSSADEADIRMAIGQLFAYAFHLGNQPVHKAVLLPKKPEERTAALLKSLGIGLMWFEADWTLTSPTKELRQFIRTAGELKTDRPQRDL